ncbi:MAG: transposase [Deltaproteobacteria bacterium]|nr:transposase [Deltaproteobacteria bacterium]
MTREYAERYRLRSGIEATNSQLKSMGGGRLRVRGYQSVKAKETMKALALNINRLTAYLCPKSRKIKGYAS